jgi:hypothetical protein
MNFTRRVIPNLSGTRGGRGRVLLVCELARGVTYRVREVPFQGWSAARNEGQMSVGNKVFRTQAEALSWCREDYYRFALERANFDALMEGDA